MPDNVELMIPGQPLGEYGSMLMTANGIDPGYRRPYFNAKGQRVVSVFTGRTKVVTNKETGKTTYVRERKEVPLSRFLSQGIVPSTNATVFRKDQWVEIDQAVYMAARARLSAWSDLVGRVSYGNFNAMNKQTFEYTTSDDTGEALIDMDGLTDGRNDRPLTTYHSVPLPIIHSDFMMSSRELGISQNGPPQQQLDIAQAERAGRRVAEMIEKLVIGVEDSFNWGAVTTGQFAHVGNSQIYGYLNHPGRFTKTDMTVPTGSNPISTLSDVIAMRETLISNQFYGPYVLYYSTDWDQYLDQPFGMTNGSNWAFAPNQTLRQALEQVKGIDAVKRLDYLTPTANNSHRFTMILVDMNKDTVSAINGMDITTVQWESKGGLQLNWKVMAIAAPIIRPRYDTLVGVVHGRTAT